MKNFPLIQKMALLLVSSLFFNFVAFSQTAVPEDYSEIEVVPLNTEDLSGKYVIQLAALETDMFMSPLMDEDNDGTAYAIDDITNCYAFDIVKEGEFYKIKSGNTLAVWGLSEHWLLEFKAETEEYAARKLWKINVLDEENALVNIERWDSNNDAFIKYEIPGNNNPNGFMKFYTDSNPDAMISFTLLKVGLPSSMNHSVTNLVNVFPNPTTDQIHIRNIANKSVIKIINALGQTVYQNVVAGENLAINVKSWKSGLYFVQINKETYKILVK